MHIVTKISFYMYSQIYYDCLFDLNPGMHELLAPLVYVLHMDILHLSQVRQRYEDPFEDRFDSLVEENISYDRQEGKQSISSRAALNDIMFTNDEDWVHRVHPEDMPLVKPDDFGFNLKTMVLGSDSYGAEGELGALLSGRFMEHDAYCMLDSLLSGCNGSKVVLADYFTSLKEGSEGLSPVLEASAAIYNILGSVDLPLYIHLVGLGVEPQFFSLRWLRVLFGREFDLEKLLVLWDAIFSSNTICQEEMLLSKNVKDVAVSSPRALFISNFAVSMMLYLRPTLLAAPNATSCLQKLLNFPKNADMRSLIENAKMLRILSQEPLKTNISSPGMYPQHIRGNRQQSLSSSFESYVPASSKIFNHLQYMGSPEKKVRPSTPESYWEERWMNTVVLPKVEPNNGDGFESDKVVVFEDNKINANASRMKENMQVNDSVSMGSTGNKKQTRRNLLGQIQEEASSESCLGSSTLSVLTEESDKGGPLHQQSLQLNEKSNANSVVSDVYSGDDDERQGQLDLCTSKVGVGTRMDTKEDQTVCLCNSKNELPQSYMTREEMSHPDDYNTVGINSGKDTDPHHIDVEKKMPGKSLQNLGILMGENIEVSELHC